MFRTLITVLPLLAATATAQIQAQPYGEELPGEAMQLTMSASADDRTATVRAENGQPGAAVVILVGGTSDVEMNLGELGIDGWLLVAPTAVTATATFDDDGRFEFSFAINDANRGREFKLQAVSVAVPYADNGPQVQMSHGLRLGIDG